MKIPNIGILIISVIAFTGCAEITKPNTNYVKTGLFKDRFDKMYYHYAETGKSFVINDHNTINASLGVQEGGNTEIINKTKTNAYWEVNYQLTF